MKKVASILLVLLLAFVAISLVACQKENHVKSFKEKIDSVNNYTVKIELNDPKTNESLDFLFKVDGDIVYYSMADYDDDYVGYQETVGDVVYTYYQKQDGSWYKNGSCLGEQVVLEDIDLTQIKAVFEMALDYNNYQKASGSIYQQKSDVSFDFLSDVQISFRGENCTLNGVVTFEDYYVDLTVIFYDVDTTLVTLPQTHPVDDFDAMLNVKNYLATMTKTTATETETYSIAVDGNKYCLITADQINYFDTGYTKYMQKDGKWYECISHYYPLFYLPTYSVFFNTSNYQAVEGQMGVYQQKANEQIYDSVQANDYVTNVKLTLTEDGCIIEYNFDDGFYTIVITDVLTTTVELPTPDETIYY